MFDESTCCDPSLEPSLRDGSNEGSQHVSMRKYGKLSLVIPIIPSCMEHWQIVKSKAIV